MNRFFSYILLLFLFSCNSEFDANDFAKNSLIVDAHINIPYKLNSQLVNNDLYENIATDTSLNFDEFLNSAPRGAILIAAPFPNDPIPSYNCSAALE